MATVIAYALAVASILWALWALARGTGRMGVRRFTGVNDGDTAKRYFLLLLSQARRQMIVYDDGDDAEESIYKDDEVLSAIESKLSSHPEFTMRCLFNCAPPKALREKFEALPCVDLRTTGLGEKAPRDPHLKVIDGGRMAYLTRHSFGSRSTPYELVDCLTVAPWALKGVARAELGGCLEAFDQKFQQA